MPGSRSGPKTNSPSSSRTAASGQPSPPSTCPPPPGPPRLRGGLVLQDDLRGAGLGPAEVPDRDDVADAVLPQVVDELVDAVDALARHLRDDVADLQPRFLGGTA